MTLGFSQQINNVPTFFVEKIYKGISELDLITPNDFYSYHVQHPKYEYDMEVYRNTQPKLHTIREDSKNKWKPGNLIHFVINNQTPLRYQFAPVLKCTSVQKFRVAYFYNPKTQEFDIPMVLVDDKEIKGAKLKLLAVNDGFDSVADFLKYFNTNFTGKIIHWTNIKY